MHIDVGAAILRGMVKIDDHFLFNQFFCRAKKEGKTNARDFPMSQKTPCFNAMYLPKKKHEKETTKSKTISSSNCIIVATCKLKREILKLKHKKRRNKTASDLCGILFYDY